MKQLKFTATALAIALVSCVEMAWAQTEAVTNCPPETGNALVDSTVKLLGGLYGLCVVLGIGKEKHPALEFLARVTVDLPGLYKMFVKPKGAQ